MSSVEQAKRWRLCYGLKKHQLPQNFIGLKATKAFLSAATSITGRQGALFTLFSGAQTDPNAGGVMRPQCPALG